MYRCLIATLGRDAPGINAAIRAVTRLAGQRQGWKVFAAKRGFPGILQKNFREIAEKDVRFILDKGGSILGSTVLKIGIDEHDTIRRIGEVFREFDLVVAIGGLGSYSVLNQLYSIVDMKGTTTHFVPASIENEFLLAGTQGNGNDIYAESIGADTAANTAISIIDRLREQSYLNQTVFLVQCVGLKSNFLPLVVGLACGAHRIYLPEFPTIHPEDLEEIQRLFGKRFVPYRIVTRELVGWLKELFFDLKKTHAMVIIPSNIRVLELADQERELPGRDYEHLVRSLVVPDFSLLRLVDDLSIQFTEHPEVQIRSVILDDLQRGGPPTMKDRLLGSLYGEAAVDEYLKIIGGQDSVRYGGLNLLAIRDVYRAAWESHPRNRITPLFRDQEPQPGGLDPVPFYRQNLGLLSGYRQIAKVE
ncbi:MAG: 6-phosphofructokinase [Planctomycetes bacterium]|nr:6-phosphofructokinase [Planctomycetota bacterium]